MRIIATIFLLLLASFSMLAFDEETEPAFSDSIHLKEVSVVAARYRKITPSQRLSGEELKALNSHSVADAIRYFSGVQIKDYGGIGGLKTIDIRGMGSNHVGVFYDGLPLGNAQNGQVDLGKFSLDNMEEISLYNGQKSEVFQTARDFGSSAGIYLRTRRPYFEGDKDFNLKGTIKAGSFDLINPSILYEQKITGDISASFNAEYLNSSGKYKFRYKQVFQDGSVAWDTTYMRQNGQIEALRLEGGVNGWTDDGEWNAKAYYYDSDRGIPGAIIANTPKAAQRQWDRNFFAQGSFRKKWGKRIETMLNAKYVHDYLRYQNPDTLNDKPSDDNFALQEMYLSLANKYAVLPNWDVSLSVDYQWNKLGIEKKIASDFDYARFKPERNTALIALATAVDFEQVKIQANVLASLVDDKQQQHFRDEYTPAVFLYYKPFARHDFSLRAFYKRIFRMPTFNELYYSDTKQIALEPEFTTQYNLGFIWNINALSNRFDCSVQADAYYNKVENKIIATPNGSNMFRFTIENLGKVKIRGLDVSVRPAYRFPMGLTLHGILQYTYQRAKDYSREEDKGIEGMTWGGQVAYIPRHSGSAVLSASYNDWNMNYSFIYVGERYTSSANTRENKRQPFYTSDLSLGKGFRYKDVGVKLAAEVNNLFDQQYDVIPNYPMPGRNYRFTLSVEI